MWAAVAVWLVAAYPLDLGPIEYAAHRGWVSWTLRYRAFRPIDRVLPQYIGIRYTQGICGAVPEGIDNPEARWFYVYTDWWSVLAFRHEFGRRPSWD